MDGMEKIIARMESDAREALEKLNAETDAQTAAIHAQSAERADAEYAAIHARGEQAAQERYERLCSAAEMETRKLTLSARQEVLGEAYALALEKLCTMPQERYLELLLRLLRGAAPKGDERVVLNKRDRDALGQALCERANVQLGTHLTLASETADIRAGFLLSSGESDVNCSFETLLALSRETTEREAVARLFS